MAVESAFWRVVRCTDSRHVADTVESENLWCLGRATSDGRAQTRLREFLPRVALRDSLVASDGQSGMTTVDGCDVAGRDWTAT